MPFEWTWGITTKYMRRADWRNIRSLRFQHALSLSGSTTLGKKKKIYATTRGKTQKEEVLTVLFFFLFQKKKKRKFLEGGALRPKLTWIMDSSSTILLYEMTLSESSIVILHLSSCWVTLRPAVFTAAPIRPSVSRHLVISFSPWGPFP